MKHFIVDDIQNPKNYVKGVSIPEKKVFPYYAGYADSFACQMIESLNLPFGATVLDPWNGSGTTTFAAYNAGMKAIGFDANPVMILAAKTSLLDVRDVTELITLANNILTKSLNSKCTIDLDDSLLQWFYPTSRSFIRAIEDTLNKYLFGVRRYRSLLTEESLNDVPTIAAFFYLVLFRVTRKLLTDFIPSNPTWVKKPASISNRKRPSLKTVHELFLKETIELSSRLLATNSQKNTLVHFPVIALGNSEKICLSNNSVDVVLSSPPYCTRIDYAVATSIELAVMRILPTEFSMLRKALMGNSTVGNSSPQPKESWGLTCNKFLFELYNHKSKASTGYYYKNHIQYFDSLYMSILEIDRVVKPDGLAILVIQDSYYKEIRNDVPVIASEMAKSAGLKLILKKDFSRNSSMAEINSKAKSYLKYRPTTESVLIFQKKIQPVRSNLNATKRDRT